MGLSSKLRRSGMGAALFGALMLAGATAAQAERVSVVLDQARVIRLPEGTRTVVVGNPAIADVAVQKNNIVIVTGKTYGSTNLLALDGAGTIIQESDLLVQAPVEDIVIVQRGLDRESYSCSPRCAPTLVPGDSSAFFAGVGAQAQQRNQLALPSK